MTPARANPLLNAEPAPGTVGPEPRPLLDAGRPIVDVLRDLLSQLETAPLELDVPGSKEARALRLQVATQLRARVLPRLREVDRPVVVVFAGSTGVGKSTLVNSIVGAEISEAGAVRPTTRNPVLARNGAQRLGLRANPVLRLAQDVAHPAVPAGVAFFDSPDMDSADHADQDLAARAIEAADVWVFVTTPNRYGDGIPWAVLQLARQRGVTVAVVLNRVGAGVAAEVQEELQDRLAASGLADAPLFTIPDLGPHEGPLPSERVAELAGWLGELAGRARGRSVVARTVRAGWPTLRADLDRVAVALDVQAAELRELRHRAERLVSSQADLVSADLVRGCAAVGGPTARWRMQSAAGGPLAGLGAKRVMIRTRGRAARARASAAVSLRADVVAAASSLLVEAASRTGRGVRSAWIARGRAGLPLAMAVDASAAARLRSERARVALEEWTKGVERAVGGWNLSGAQSRILDAHGWASLVCAAAVGVGGAARSVDAALGEAGKSAREAAQQDLVARAAELVQAEASAFLEALAASGVESRPAESLRATARELEVVA